jgi:hypothetical protein
MHEKVIVDASIHRAFTVTYAIYLTTACIASFSLPPSLQAVGGEDLTALWLLGLGATAAFSLFFSLQESRQRREMISTSLQLAFLISYSVALLWNGVSNWNVDLIMVGVFTTSFSVMPMWRVLFFFRKYRKPREDRTPRG